MPHVHFIADCETNPSPPARSRCARAGGWEPPKARGLFSPVEQLFVGALQDVHHLILAQSVGIKVKADAYGDIGNLFQIVLVNAELGHGKIAHASGIKQLHKAVHKSLAFARLPFWRRG